MKVTYNNYIDLNNYKKLLNDAGQKMLSDNQHLNSINNSIFLFCCICDDEVVGADEQYKEEEFISYYQSHLVKSKLKNYQIKIFKKFFFFTLFS